MKTSTVAVISSLVLMLLLAACGGEEATSTSEATPTSPQEPTTPPVSPAPAGMGTLEVRVTDQPVDDVSAIVLTVRNIQVHQSGDGGESGWRTVLEGPFEFDLLQLDGIEDILGSATLEPGRYQQIRLEVVSAQVTIPNGVRSAGVSSDKLRIVGGFEVVEGETTIFTLDFDAQRSLIFIPMQGPQLKPVVKLLARKKGQDLAEATTVASIGEDTAGEGNTAQSSSTGSRAPRAGAEGLIPVGVAVPTADNLQFMSFWIALGADFFKDKGLDVQVIVPPSPLGTGQFLLQGRADVAVLPPPMYLPLIGEGAEVLLFANLLENDQINLIVRKEVMEQRELSTTAPLVERLQGIRGLKVGVAPGPPTRLRVLFASVGLDADQDIEMVIVHGLEQNQAFEDGLVDALYAHTPFLERAIVQQGAVVLVNQSAGEVPELAGRQSHSLVTTRTFAAAQREVLVAMARAVHRAQQLIHTDQQAAIRAILQSGVPGLDRELVETIVGIYAPAIPSTPVVSVDGVTRVHELYPAHQTPPDLSGIDLSKYVAIDIAQEATEES